MTWYRQTVRSGRGVQVEIREKGDVVVYSSIQSSRERRFVKGMLVL